MNVILNTPMGTVKGNEREECLEFLGIPYAKAKRFEYAVPVERFEEELDATKFGPACPQYREFFPHLDVPERLFYHREFRDGLTFEYDEDNCLNLNIYTPKEKGTYPVVVFIHGGGFNSMCNSESYLDGKEYAKRGIVMVAINYRVGVFGYYSNEEMKKKHGRDGNFGLDDMLVAIKWVKSHISCFGGDPLNITVMGQSAGAMSIQMLCVSPKADGLYQRAIMMSGAGLFPKIALPKKSEDTHEYWKQVMEIAKAKTFEEFQALPVKDVLAAVEVIKTQRKDNLRNTQPVIDGYLLPDMMPKLMKHPRRIDYMIGYTNNDMYTYLLARMAHHYTKKNGAYLYFFDIDAPGDGNLAFHSCDLRYFFGTLGKSWRPYDQEDEVISKAILDYVCSFIASGDPNGEGRPAWERGKVALCIEKTKIAMHGVPKGRLLKNTLKGDPK